MSRAPLWNKRSFNAGGGLRSYYAFAMSSVSLAKKLTRGEKEMVLRFASSANDAPVCLTPKNLEEKFILQNSEKMGLATKVGADDEFQGSSSCLEVANELRTLEAS